MLERLSTENKVTNPHRLLTLVPINNNNNNNAKYIARMFNVRTKVMSVTTVASGTISELFRKYLENIAGKQEMKKLQKTATLGGAHIPRKVLMKKYKTFIKENSITCTASCNYRTAATLSTLAAWFVSGT